MLEVIVGLELYLAKYTEAAIIGVLLVFNATLSFVEERRAQNALELLKSRLSVSAHVLRDGNWTTIEAGKVVPGDTISLKTGDIVPADAKVREGGVSVDQSTLTGESQPVDAATGGTVYSGSIVRNGECRAEVTATGPHTYFGKTAELVRTAKTQSHLESIVFNVVKYLVALDIVLVIAVIVYAFVKHLALSDAIPFALILLVASVPIALQATFTLSEALGSLSLIRRGVLVTHLSAIEEAAAMDILITDKTGTITENRLAIGDVLAYPPNGRQDVLHYAALASDQATQDPIDLEILKADGGQPDDEKPKRLNFIAFDPKTKRSEALFEADGGRLKVVKGAPSAIAMLTGSNPEGDVQALSSRGERVLAVAKGSEDKLELVGLLGFRDPPRQDSAELIGDLENYGLRVMMVTGDGLDTAKAVASQVGLGENACAPAIIDKQNVEEILHCDIFANVFPEDKFRLVEKLQRSGHVTGMTGDGVNDAPALKQAEVGIAVANATDVAKAAASLVLTNPGLASIVGAVQEGRSIYQRMLTYTFNKIIKTFQIGLFLSLGLLFLAVFVTTPRLILLLLFANDFLTMSISADRVRPSKQPERWDIRRLSAASLVLAVIWLLFSFGIFYLGRDVFRLDLPRLQTLLFLMLVFSGQATVYLVRERRHFWSSRPGTWLLAATAFDIVVMSLLAVLGLLMPAISLSYVVILLVIVLAYMFAFDYLKIGVFRWLGIG
jgi:H+-transporting ATPase